jgi:hypothetical protein
LLLLLLRRGSLLPRVLLRSAPATTAASPVPPSATGRAFRLLRSPAAGLLRLLLPLARAVPARRLFELLHFSLHELPRDGVLAKARLVVAAIGTTLPAFGIGLVAGLAEDTFRERHENRRIIDFRRG